jgi:hypothetical protein
MGAIIIGLSFYLHGAEFFQSSDNEKVQKIGDVAFYIMIIFGGLAIISALLAFLTVYCNNKACSSFVSYHT